MTEIMPEYESDEEKITEVKTKVDNGVHLTGWNELFLKN
jgi:hypothetical protein